MTYTQGFTLVELLVAVVLFGLLSSIAMPSYMAYVDRANQTQAMNDIQEIQIAIEQRQARTFEYPDSLDEIPGIPRFDPWGGAYTYLRIDGNTTAGLKGLQRKDKNLNPLNSDFDLYSPGKDGKTKLPLTAKDALDDIIRAGNGGFIGLAEDH